MRRLFFSSNVAKPGIHATSAILAGVRPLTPLNFKRFAQQMTAVCMAVDADWAVGVRVLMTQQDMSTKQSFSKQSNFAWHMLDMQAQH